MRSARMTTKEGNKMAEYIDKQKALAAIQIEREYMTRRHEWGAEHILTHYGYRIIADMPPADVEPVRHGRWEITDAYPHTAYCSECHKRYAQTHWSVWEDGSLPREYCPNCGARMDGEQDV